MIWYGYDMADYFDNPGAQIFIPEDCNKFKFSKNMLCLYDIQNGIIGF